MFELKSTSRPIRKAFLVGVYSSSKDVDEAFSLVNELADLMSTLGIPVSDSLLVKLVTPQPRFYVGSGKAEEIIRLAKEKKAEVIVFDDSLTPAQQRNWEKLSGLAVIDREEVILDIFSRRARTREARLQVELARMVYSLPRLTRAWEHLSRQGGSGFGAMGAGETQLETDRRLVRQRIDRLRDELKDIRSQRATQRKQRLRGPIPHAAIVGYTNAGKSSLFRRLTGADAFVEDKLFATLDTMTRKLKWGTGQTMLLTDTVGFVRKLPHQLVESFKATLEESIMADFLIHVLDVTNENVRDFYDTTMDVLEELGADLKKVITVFNKIDLLEDKSRIASLKRQFPEALFVSAETGEGLEQLSESIVELLRGDSILGSFLVPQARYDLISALHQHGAILSEEYEGDHVRLTARLPLKLLSRYEPFKVHAKDGRSRSNHPKTVHRR